MIVRGSARKDGLALADYLTSEAQKKNDHVTVLEVRHGATQDLHKALFDMDVSVELTKRGKKGLYQATINPAYGEDRQMTEKDWLLCADILEKKLGFTDQNRILVLHEKKGRIHAHVAWQREKDGKLISISHNYKKHDEAREEMEIALQQGRTLQPKDNKQALTNIWNSSTDARDFIAKAEAMGYKIGRGDRRAYVVQTPDGQKLDLVRQLQGIKTNQVRDRFKDIENTLPNEKDLAGQERMNSRQQEKLRRKEEAFAKRQPVDQKRIDTVAKKASENFADMFAKPEPKPEDRKEIYVEKLKGFQDNFSDPVTDKAIAANDNFKDVTRKQETDQERRSREADEIMRQRELAKNKNKGRSL